MNQQTISAPGSWNQISLLAFLACFKIRTGACVSHLSKSLLPWRNSVGWYIILYCATTDELADDFRSRIVEPDVFTRLIGLLQNPDWGVRQSSVEVITTLAEFGRLIYHIVVCED